MAFISLSSTTVFLLLGLAIVYITYSIVDSVQLQRRRQAFKLQHGCKDAPSNRTWDIFGLYGMFVIISAARQHKLLEHWDDTYKKKGTTHRGIRRGRQFITTMDAENFKAIHATNFDDWSTEDARKAFHPFLGKGVFTTDGAFWAHSRAVLRPQFEKQQVAEVAQFEPHVQNLFQHIPLDGSTCDLQDLFHKFTMDTSSEFLSGTSTGLLAAGSNPKGLEFAKAFETATHNGTLRARLGSFYWLASTKEGRDSVKVSRAYADGWVNEAMRLKETAPEKIKQGKGQYVFLNELAKDPSMDADRIRDEMLNIMLAGRDTTASLLSSLFFELSRNPEALNKLRSEVAELHGELPTYAQLREMKYLKYSAQEALRLYPPVPALVKTAIRDTFIPLGGGPQGKDPLFVAKNDLLFYNHRSMMRSQDVYGADAEVFKPERWADPALRPGWNYLPFGGGARTCLGQQYALTEAYYVTVRLLQEYSRLESRDSGPWQEKFSATLSSLNGTKVALFR